MRRTVSFVAALVLATVAAACGGGGPAPAGVELWPEADALFHQDPRWLGSDGGISVDLGGDRVVWLIPDTFVALTRAHVREESCLVRNTVGLMTGSDPERGATMTFYWRTARGGLPESFFPKGRDVCFQHDDAWFWPGDGERLGENGPLLIFLIRQRPTSGGLGFVADGWEAVMALFGEALPEFVYLDEGGDFVALQTIGFGGASLGTRTSPALTGPWSSLNERWRPPESSREGVFVSGFKAHPELDAGDAVALTYATNAGDFADVVADESLGFPRFARLRLER